MKTIFSFLLIITLCFGQDYKKMFDPNTTYLDRGQMTITYTNTSAMEEQENFAGYKMVNGRTAAVDPTKILPGSILFIPALAGIKLNDGTYHDGYVFAHRVLKTYPAAEIKIYLNGMKSIAPLKGTYKVFNVQGVMAKSLRVRYEMQFNPEGDLPTHKMVADDFEKLLSEGNTKFKSISDRIQFYSKKGMGTPYLVYNLGEGAGDLIDPDPTIDFSRTDCMTFCEHTLALAISSGYNEMYNNLQKIRYKNGRISYLTRNHYTISDWLPNNSWLLEDVTRQIGGDFTKTITKTIDRMAFYRNNGVPEKELINAPATATLTADYIPEENILQLAGKLKGGDIVSVITTNPAVFSAHMGIIVIDHWNNIIFRHASSSANTYEVLDEKLSDYLDKMFDSKSRIGMLIMRPRPEFTIPR